jgi:hypothetical protein
MKKTMMTMIAALFAVMTMAQTADTTKPTQPVRERKPIREFKIWKNGQQFDASDIDVVCVFDDYRTTARVYYQISDSLGVVVADGNIDITGAEYEQYARKANHPDTGLQLTLKALKLQERAAAAARQAARQAAASGTTTNQ